MIKDTTINPSISFPNKITSKENLAQLTNINDDLNNRYDFWTDHENQTNLTDKKELKESTNDYATKEVDIKRIEIHSDRYLLDMIRKNLAEVLPIILEWKSYARKPESVVYIGRINSLIDALWSKIPKSDQLIGTTLSLIRDSISNHSWQYLDESQILVIVDIFRYVINTRNANYYEYASSKMAKSKIRTLPELKANYERSE
jgi:hypothetical protein